MSKSPAAIVPNMLQPPQLNSRIAMDPDTRATEIEDLFATAGFDRALAVRLARAPLAVRLWPNLVPQLSKSASENRCSEFADGRELANRCLAVLGAEPQMIGRGAHREPLWPAGICGSITHTTGLVAAVAGLRDPDTRASVGLDAERVTNLEAANFQHIFTRTEQNLLTSLNATEHHFFATCFFSAKEAIFKAQFPLTSHFVDFNEVSLQPASGSAYGKSGWLRVHSSVPQLDGFRFGVFYTAIEDYVLTGCVMVG